MKLTQTVPDAALVVIHGHDLGKKFDLDGDEPLTIGRSSMADIAVPDDVYASRAHCTIQRTAEGWLVSDLASLGGTWVDGDRVTAPHLIEPGSRVSIKVGRTILRYVEPHTVHDHDGCGCVLRTTKDGLTGTMTKSHFIHQLDAHLAAGEPACTIALDLVAFKRINDTHGHLIGDQVLRDLAAVLMRTVGEKAWICRAGGEEFVVMVPTQSRVSAEDLAETLAVVVEQTHFDYPDGVGRLDISLWRGVAEMEEGFDAMALFKAAFDVVDASRRAARHGG